MSAHPGEADNSQSKTELVQENERLKVLVNEINKERVENERIIAELRQNCVYYEKAILAWSRSRITADELTQWINEKPEEGFNFEELMTKLCGRNKDS